MIQPQITNAEVAKLTKIFREHFLLSDNDISELINKILNENNEQVALKLVDMYQKFAEIDIIDLPKDKRQKLAKQAILATYDSLIAANDVTLRQFLDMLHDAKLYGIEPLKLVNKTNFEHATRYSLQSAIVSLTQTKFEDIHGGSLDLFNKDEVKTLFEECATLASGVSNQKIQQVLDILGEFVYDREAGGYIIEPVHFLRKCKTLITAPTKTLRRNVEFLQARFTPSPMSRNELIARVAISPSILLCNPQTIQNFELNMLSALQEIIDTYNLNKSADYAENIVKNISDIDKFTQITKINPDKIALIKNVLIKHIGPENALECLTDFNMLYMDARVLDCVLAKVSSQDMQNLASGKTSINKLKYLLQNTSATVEASSTSTSSNSSGNKTGISHQVRTRKINEKQFTHISDDVADAMYNNLTAKERLQVDEILNNLNTRLQATKKYDGKLSPQEEEEFAIMLAEEEAEKARIAAEEKRQRLERINQKRAEEHARRQEALRRAEEFDRQFAELMAQEEAEKRAKQAAQENEQFEDELNEVAEPEQLQNDEIKLPELAKVVEEVNHEVQQEPEEELIELVKGKPKRLSFVDKSNKQALADQTVAVPKSEIKQIITNLQALQASGLQDIGRTEYSILLNHAFQVLKCCVNTNSIERDLQPAMLASQNKRYTQICKEFYVEFNKLMQYIVNSDYVGIASSTHKLRPLFETTLSIAANVYSKFSLETLSDIGLGYLVQDIKSGKVTRQDTVDALVPTIVDALFTGCLTMVLEDANALAYGLTVDAVDHNLIDEPVYGWKLLDTNRIKEYLSRISPTTDFAIAAAMIEKAATHTPMLNNLSDSQQRTFIDDVRKILKVMATSCVHLSYDDCGYYVGSDQSIVYRPVAIDKLLIDKLEIRRFDPTDCPNVVGNAYLQDFITLEQDLEMYHYEDAHEHNPSQPFSL